MSIDKEEIQKESLSIVKRLRENGFIPKDINPQFSRGHTHYFVKEMWNDAANNSEHIIKRLNQALDQELSENEPLIKEMMSKNLGQANTPCGGKMDFIKAPIDKIKALDNEEKKK